MECTECGEKKNVAECQCGRELCRTCREACEEAHLVDAADDIENELLALAVIGQDD